ncbi:MAG: hypothetical protein AAFR17_09430 [Pseudomonadota bacterium]
MRLGLPLILLAVVAAAVVIAEAWFPSLAVWAIEQQRAFQNEIARAVYALRAAEPGALVALMSAAAAYGFVHAVGPGHGKYLIGGVGLGSRVSSGRLVGIGMASSLAQAAWAIVLVYGGLWLLRVSAQQLTAITEDILAPISYLAIGAIGALLLWRGTSGLSRAVQQRDTHVHSHSHDHGHGHGHAESSCGCPAHRLDPAQIAGLTSFREVLALILSVAVRPCTGAVLLLIIAWQLDLLLAGAVAVVAMGLGTGALVSLVAVSSVTLRGFAQVTARNTGIATMTAPCLQLIAGGLIIWLCVSFLRLQGFGGFA